MSTEENDTYTEEDLYEVEELVDKKVTKSGVRYFVKWTGYDHSQNTWEPKEHLPDEMVEEYEEKLKKKKKEKAENNTKRKIENSSDEKPVKNVIIDNKSNEMRPIPLKKLPPFKVSAQSKKDENEEIIKEVQEGNLKADLVERVVDLKVYRGKDNKKAVVVEVEFKKRLNGFQPKSGFYLYEVIYENYPKLLLDAIMQKMVVSEKEENWVEFPDFVKDIIDL
jgi:hypothetical protein